MSRTPVALISTLLAALAPVVLFVFFGHEHVMLPAPVHFGLVSSIAIITSLASLALTVAGAQARDGRTVLMGVAFSTMTALFAVHALATPGFITGPNGVIALAGGISVPVVAGLLALTALPALRRPNRLAPLIATQILLFIGVLLLGLIGPAAPHAAPAVPAPGSPPAIFLLIAGEGFLALLIVRAVRTYMLSRRVADLT